MSELTGIATTDTGDPVDVVRIFNWPDGGVVESISPNSDGSWSTVVPAGVFGITYIADSCIPQTHGPYTVTVTDLFWTPAEIVTLLWIDPSDPLTVVLDSQQCVEVLEDKSGNSNNLINTNGSNRPVILSGGINNKDVLDFGTSGNTWLGTNNNVGGLVSIFYVQKTSDTSYILLSEDANSAVATGPIVQSSTNSTVAIDFGTPNYFVNGSSVVFNNRASVLNTLGSNSVLVECIGADISNWINFELAGYPTSTFHYTGQVAELIIVPGVIDKINREKIEGYLAHKWGLIDALPSEHPYKNNSPITVVHPYNETILADNPLAYINFDNGTGQDKSINKNHGVLIGTVSTVESPIIYGPNKHSVNLTGSGYISLSAVIGKLFYTYTIEAWIKTDNDSTGSYGLAIFSAHDSSKGNILRLVQKGGRLYLIKGNGSENSGTVIVNDNLNHHIALVADATKVTVYVDGQEDIVLNQSLSLVNAAYVSIGQEYDPGGPSDYFKGYLDELTVYDVALPSEKVLQHYNEGMAHFFTPEKLDLALWLDASDSQTMTIDGSGYVEHWEDKSGNSRSFSQSIEAQRPVFETNTLNGNPTVYFRASSFLELATGWASGNNHTLIAVVSPPSSGDRRYLMSAGITEVGEGSNNTLLLFALRNDNQKVGYFDGSSWKGTASAVSNSQVISYVLDGANNNGSIYRNGESIEFGIPYNGNDFDPTRRVLLGARDGASTNWSEARISEVILLNKTVSETDRRKIEEYLAEKWGIAL